MNSERDRGAIFISYAWGGELQHKEWVRRCIVAHLDWNYRVFWDRDSINFGQSITEAIDTALAERPLLVLCLCDQDYLDAAERTNSGLYRELQALTEVANSPGVRIVPLLLSEGCEGQFPAPLDGRLYLDLRPLHTRGLDLGAALLNMVEGVSQAQVQRGIQNQVAMAKLRQRAYDYLKQYPLSLFGDGCTHDVMVRPEGQVQFPLLAPQWMWDSKEWGFMLGDENSTYCPVKGRWHWDRFSASRGMRALGTAALSAFFPRLVGEHEQRALNVGGAVLAVHFFTTNKVNESFIFDMNDLITFMILDFDGYGVLESLLDAMDRQ